MSKEFLPLSFDNVEQSAPSLLPLVAMHGSLSLELAVQLTGSSAEELFNEAVELQASGEAIAILDDRFVFTAKREMRPFVKRMGQDYLQKYLIGRSAAELLGKGDVVAVEAGSTLTIFAQHLAGVPVSSVYTNCLSLSAIVAERQPELEVHLAGGWMQSDGQSILGDEAEAFIAARRYDWGIVSPNAISVDGVLYYGTEEEAAFACRISARAQQVLVLANSAKVGVKDKAAAFHLREADIVISDDGLGAQGRKLLAGEGGARRLILAEIDEDSPEELVLLDL
ncbi:DeoR/GlpR family DNA-binding transcription regulator [Polycladidibacter hongkongensis]|uniref:DeoR/GlpR family DNA-binding transcription regulator n=1 Tax=Polycladidibacter hongkongensis TaxID=1647556 RepID=UPI00082CD186|nr:DeoR/GlpR family DNA-binding transcription regulator [Pseudovibrio hongkongensis]